ERAGREITIRIGDVRDFGVGQCGAALNQRQVKSDGEGGIRSRQLDGVGCGALVDHQAATRQDAFAMRQDDRAVDGFGIAEIVAVDDKRDWRARGSKVAVTAHLQTATGRCSANASSDSHRAAFSSNSSNILGSLIPPMSSMISAGSAPKRILATLIILARK